MGKKNMKKDRKLTEIKYIIVAGFLNCKPLKR
jgi:hypothetical protein